MGALDGLDLRLVGAVVLGHVHKDVYALVWVGTPCHRGYVFVYVSQQVHTYIVNIVYSECST
jgi:hypothetical protein